MIGVFDSGVGGMTVARAIERRLPGVRLVYFGDLARAPYGQKSPETIARYARQNTEFLLAQGARVIVVACNSAASVAAELLRRRFPVPLFEVVSPAIAQAVATTVTGRIGVIGTRATIKSGIYERTIRAAHQDFKVFSQACPLLVPLVEEGWLARRETKMIVRRYLSPLKRQQVDTLVLGCTHYPLLRPVIQPRIGRRVRVIDSSEALAADLQRFLRERPGLLEAGGGGDNRYYVSDVTEAAVEVAQRIFGRRIDLLKVAAGQE